jgi:hypothetical protein
MAVSEPDNARTNAPSPPCRLRRLIGLPLWRSAARGLVAVLLVSAIVLPLACIGWTMLAIFAAITVGLNLGLWSGRDSGLASLAGAVLVATVGLVIALCSDVQVIGPGMQTVALADIQQFPYATQFRFTDARVATEFSGVADGHRLNGAAASGAWRVAPIVPANWTSADPVPAWAVAVTSGYGPLDFRTPRNWQQNYQAAVRYVATAFSPAQTAIASATARYGLVSAAQAPLLYWVEEPHAVIADERTFFAWVMFGGVATWLCFLVGEALLVPESASDDAEHGPPRLRRPPTDRLVSP